MSSEFCSICSLKRASRALCNCCREYLCLEHLKEHEQLLHQQFEPLADRLNQMIDHFEHLNIEDFLRQNREELYRWHQQMIESIEKIYREKSKEIEDFYVQQFDDLSQRTKQIRNEVAQIIRSENGTKQQIQRVTESIDKIDEQRKTLAEKPLQLNIRSLEIDSSIIEIHIHEEEKKEKYIFDLSQMIQTTNFLSNEIHLIATNSLSILISDHAQLFLYDHNLILLNQSDIRDDMKIQDLCWSSTLNRFLILSDENLFLLDQRKMSIDKCSIVKTPQNGHWHQLTCSHDFAYLTAYRWGTRIYQYHLSSNSIQFYRCFEISRFSSKDDSVDSLVHNQQSCIAMVISNRIHNLKRFELRLDEDFSLIWSMELHLAVFPLHSTQFSLINGNQWIIFDSHRSEMIFISSEGSIQQTIPYPYEDLQRIVQIQPNFLLAVTNRSANLHQIF